MILNNIKTPNQLMEYMQNNLQYGFVAKNKIYLDNNPNFQKDMDKYYKLSSPARLIKSGYGVCWDFCELQRAFFKANNIPYECYFIHSFKNRVEGGPTHSFTLFYANEKCYWFEFSWQSNRGIWQFENKQQALKKIIGKSEAKRS